MCSPFMVRQFCIYILLHFFSMQVFAQSNNGSLTNIEYYTNPILFFDYSDPDVVKVGNDFYMVTSSFSHFPGLPILHSNDLVNWKIIGHAAINYPFDEFKLPKHGKGIWAPSLRYHNGEFWIYFGDPDHGILMTKTKNPSAEWSPLLLVMEGKGLIDPCPLWDEDGKAYLVHAWAKSRAGFNSIISINEISSDGKNIIGERVDVFNGLENHKTIEGPKFYKRNGFYYIFAPAGGVKQGWQTILRSKNIYGPYTDKIALEQGSTNINGPHQGGLVQLENGESWFIHSQDKKSFGRVVHINPVEWIDDWPMIGVDYDGNGIGEPVSKFQIPSIKTTANIKQIQTSDEFESPILGLQWQWEALPDTNWFSLHDNPGSLRLFCIQKKEEYKSLRDLPNIIGQKFIGPKFSATIEMSVNFNNADCESGMVVLGIDYSVLKLKQINKKKFLIYSIFRSDKEEGIEAEIYKVEYKSDKIFLSVDVDENAECSFSYSSDGNNFLKIENKFKAMPGRWVGAKICLFSNAGEINTQSPYSEFNFVRLER
jgi:beta-xylosidase